MEAFELNQADTATLKKIKGIGEKLSQKIVNYREKLGGFVRMDQLSEVYGLEEVVINELKKFAYLKDAYLIRKININLAGLEELGKHPYIGYKLAKQIVNYRKAQGSIENEEAFLKIEGISPDIFQKIKPYLIFK